MSIDPRRYTRTPVRTGAHKRARINGGAICFEGGALTEGAGVLQA